MDFDIAVNIINTLLKKEKPKTFSSSWILSRTPAVYHFVRKNLRTENNDIDWDSFTIALDRQYLRRWIRYKRKSAKTYKISLKSRSSSQNIKTKCIHLSLPLKVRIEKSATK